MNATTLAALGLGCGVLFLLPGCGKREEAVRQELKESGYDLTPEAWFRAAESDDTTALSRLLKGGIELDTRNEAGDSALHAAAAAGMQKSAGFLLDRGMAVDLPGGKDRTPLMSAVIDGRPAMVRYLLKQGADPLKKDADGFKPLMIAVREGRADMVAELAAYDREDLDNALLAAALLDQPKVIDELTNYGASLYTRMDDGRTALMLAAENGHTETVDLLLEIGANRFSMDEQGRIAADLAREAGYEDLALALAAEPEAEEFGIEEPEEAGLEMLAGLERHAGEGESSPGEVPWKAPSAIGPLPRTDSPSLSAGEAPSSDREDGVAGSQPWNRPVPGASSPAAEVSPVLLEGAIIAKTANHRPRESGEAAHAGPAETTPSAPKEIDLVMRSFRQKELPLRVETVSPGRATVRIAGGPPREVAVGAAIPGSALKVVRVDRRMRETKENEGRPVEVSVLEIEDTSTGRRRELVAGIPATAHDPVALVEDATTGRRYIARAGQKFRDADGAEYSVVDVRPNQMVIEKTGSDEVWTIPLRGSRG